MTEQQSSCSGFEDYGVLPKDSRKEESSEVREPGGSQMERFGGPRQAEFLGSKEFAVGHNRLRKNGRLRYMLHKCQNYKN